MKKIILVHGWGGSPKDGWLPWLKKELKAKGFKVQILAMPNSFKPKIDKWVHFLSKLIKNPDKNTYFVGHSIGCQTILRYLQDLSRNVKIGGVIFVAGWFNLTDETWDEDYTKEIANPWIKTKINFDKVKIHTNKFINIASDDDPYVPLSDLKIFKKKLGAKIIIEHKKGHIDQKKLPSALKAVLEISI